MTQARSIDQTVLVEVTYQIEVPLVEASISDEPVTAPIGVHDAIKSISIAIRDRDWGGHSTLGKAFTNARLIPWNAVNMLIVSKARRKVTYAEALHEDMLTKHSSGTEPNNHVTAGKP